MKKEFKITKKNSPNKMSRRGWKPDMIVNHITEGSYAGAVSWLCNPKSGASAHFVISRKGEITQLVDIREAAWANGTSTDPNKNNYYGKSSLKLVRDRKTNANYYTISIEHEGFYKDGYGALTPEQLEATIWLHKYIIDEVKKIYGIDIPIDREHIVGHYQIDPIRKPNCPGKAFQWDKLIEGLKEGVIDMVLEQWQKEMGEKAIENLSQRKIKGELIVNSPEQWKKTLGEPVPQWLFWSIIDRITK